MQVGLAAVNMSKINHVKYVIGSPTVGRLDFQCCLAYTFSPDALSQVYIWVGVLADMQPVLEIRPQFSRL